MLTIDPTTTITFTADVIYQPACTNGYDPFNVISSSSVVDYQYPFYASSTPLVFVLGATTVLAWTLTLILFITPGTFTGTGRMSNWLQRRGISSVISNRQSILGSGSRPLLQKMAALFVAISLTIATAETFMVARYQYDRGYMNTDTIRDNVAGILALRIMRVISFIFLWLAQVQTLIRLFPRHKEKLIIKWIGFLLILLDLIFGSLNAFLANVVRERPRSFQDAIPALSYLFELALSLLYAAWVFYYVMTKRRYAFFHPNMPSISIIALLSSVSILIPVVFFVADIAQPKVDGWGDHIRWVGAAAASIIVWEWVERIEALELEEKRDGILGREIYDGDEMLDISPNDITRGPRRPITLPKKPALTSSGISVFLSSWLPLSRSPRDPSSNTARQGPKSQMKLVLAKVGLKKKEAKDDNVSSGTSHSSIDVPRLVASPIDRTGAGSVESTLYVVRYHQATITPPPLLSDDVQAEREDRLQRDTLEHIPPSQDHVNNAPLSHAPPDTQDPERPAQPPAPISKPRRASQQVLSFAAMPFRTSRKSPPIEVKNALQRNGSLSVGNHQDMAGRTGMRRALGGFIGGGDAGDRSRRSSRAIVPLEPTVIPAPPRGHTWSPDIHRHSPLTYPPPAMTESMDRGGDVEQGINSGRVALLGSAEPSSSNAPESHSLRSAEVSGGHTATGRNSPRPSQGGPGETG